MPLIDSSQIALPFILSSGSQQLLYVDENGVSGSFTGDGSRLTGIATGSGGGIVYNTNLIPFGDGTTPGGVTDGNFYFSPSSSFGAQVLDGTGNYAGVWASIGSAGVFSESTSEVSYLEADSTGLQAGFFGTGSQNAGFNINDEGFAVKNFNHTLYLPTSSGNPGDVIATDDTGHLYFTPTPGTASFATTGSNVFIGGQIISGSADSMLSIITPNDGPWAFKVLNETYSSSSAALAGFIWNDGRASIGSEVDNTIEFATNNQYYNPQMVISSSGIAINTDLVVSGSQRTSGQIYTRTIIGEGGQLAISDDSANGGVDIYTTSAGGELYLDADGVHIMTDNQNAQVKIWLYDKSGSITFPDGTIQSTAYTGGGGGSSSLTLHEVLTYGNESSGSDVILTEGDRLVVGANRAGIGKGSFDNGTGGDKGISTYCAVGYELNFQGGQLSNSYNNTYAPLKLNSDLTFSASGATISADAQAEYGATSGPFTIKGSDGINGGNGGGNVIIKGGNSFTGEAHTAGDVQIYGGINTYDSPIYGGYVRLYTSGSERLTVTNDGKVGINNSTPTEALDVTGNIKATLFIGDLDGTSSFALTASHYEGSVESASYAATASISVQALSAYYSDQATSASWAPYQPSSSYSSTSSYAPNYVLNSQTSSFTTTGSNTFNGSQTITGSLNVTGSSTFNGYVVASGNLGVNTINPITPLDVHGSTNSGNVIQINNTLDQKDTRIAILQSGSTEWFIGNEYASGSNNFAIWDASGAPLVYKRLTLTAGGALTATSFTGSLYGSSSYAVSASWAPAASTFPYTGTASISGSLILTGSLSQLGNCIVSGTLGVSTIGATQIAHGGSTGLLTGTASLIYDAGRVQISTGYDGTAMTMVGGKYSSFNVWLGGAGLSNNMSGRQYNTIIGQAASGNGASGNYNVVVGAQAGLSMGGRGNAFNSYNVIIGTSAAPQTEVLNSVIVGYGAAPAANSQTNQTVIGYGAIGNGSNTNTIGNSGSLNTTLYGNLSVGKFIATSSLLNIYQPETGSGVIVITSGSINIAGASGSQFTNTFKVADTLTVNNTTYTISAVVSDASMSLSPTPTASFTGAYTLTGGSRFNVYGNGNAVFPGGYVGVGVASPLNPLHVVNTATSQLRLGYDASNYMSVNVGSGGSTNFAITAAGSPIFSFNKAINGLFQTDSTSQNANFASINSYNGSTGITNAAYLIGSAAGVNVKTWFYGSGGTAVGSNNSYSNVLIASSPVASVGTNQFVNSLSVKPVGSITGAGTVTNTSAVYIDGTATGGVNNYALYINSGSSHLGSSVNVSGSIKVNGNLAVNGPTTRVQANTITSSLANSSSTIITFDTVIWDSGSAAGSNFNMTNANATINGYTVGPYAFSPSVPGYYQISGHFSFGTMPGSTGTIITTLYKNGSEYCRGTRTPCNTSGGSGDVNTTMYFNGAGDYVQIIGLQNSGGTATTEASPTFGSWFCATMMRGA